MYCTNCGKSMDSDSRFCSGCGAGTTQRAEQHAPKQERKNAFKQPWVYVVSLGLLLSAAIVLFFMMKQPAPLKEQQASVLKPGAAAVSQTPQTKSETKKSAPVLAAVPAAPAKPAFMKINQVDSGNYAKGRVDVYFSLFSDENFQNRIDLKNLSKKFFTVNNAEVASISPILKKDSVSVNLVLDRSGSMLQTPNSGISQTKMELVRQAATDFLSHIPASTGGNYELLSFSSTVMTEDNIPFTKDRSALISSLSTMQSNGGDTALYDALTQALFHTNMQDGPKYVIAFTDGEDSGYGASAQSVIDLSRQLGIPIFTIGFGDSNTGLMEIASQTGGKNYSISENDDLQTKLQSIYNSVFNTYNNQYKLTFTPRQQVKQAENFSISLALNSPEYKAQTTQQSTRKLDFQSAQVLEALHQYQVNYAEAVNSLNFSVIEPYVHPGYDFYTNLKNRIEIDYVKNDSEGKKTIISPIENFKVNSINPQQDGSYKISFFKLFLTTKDGKSVFEADVNTYRMTQDSGSWKVSEFVRDQCSIYNGQNDSGAMCNNGVKKPYNGDPWKNDYQ